MAGPSLASPLIPARGGLRAPWPRRFRGKLALGIITLFGALPALVLADEPKKNPEGIVDAQLKEDLALLAQAKILFGHHSVGDNLLQGLRELAAEAGAPAKVDELRPGKNGDPKAKVDDWLAAVLALPKDAGAVVLMKFCYADFAPSTNADQLFEHYRGAVERVRKERPDLTIMHVTAPLTVPKSDWKSRLKRTLGREVWEDGSALQRQAYNEKLRAGFKGEPLFDLAAWESTRPNGQPERFDVAGRSTEALYEPYTYDGGHLNELGRKTGARQLARALAATVKVHQAKAPPPVAAPAEATP